MTEVFNKIESKQTRRFLRKNMPSPESILWSKLRNRQILNSKWRRQYSIGKFIVDFYCPNQKLAIELDGESHFTKKAILYDQNREKAIELIGIRFLRFTNVEVMNNLEGILEIITRDLTLPLLGKERPNSHLTLPLLGKERPNSHLTLPLLGKERNQ